MRIEIKGIIGLSVVAVLASCVLYETFFKVTGQVVAENGIQIHGCEVALQQVGVNGPPMGNIPLTFPSVFTDTYVGKFQPEDLFFIRVVCEGYADAQTSELFSARSATEAWPDPYDVGKITMRK